MHGLALGADDGCAAVGALVWHLEYALFTGSEGSHGPEYLGDNLTGPLDNDGIADSDIASMDVVLIVERGLFDCCATDYHGHQLCEGVEGTSAAYVDTYVHKLGCCLLGGELIGDGPSRFPAHEAQLLLQGDLVNFNDNAVGGVVEVCQMLFPSLEVGLDLFNVVDELGVGADPEAEGLEILEHFPVSVGTGPSA